MYYQEYLFASSDSCIEKMWILDSDQSNCCPLEYTITPNGFELMVISYKQANPKIMFNNIAIPVPEACIFIQPYTSWKLCIEDSIGMIGAFFKAGSFRNLFKAPIKTMVGKVLELQEYLEHELVLSFQKQLVAALPGERIDLAMRFFSSHFSTHYSPTHLFPYILRLIHTHQGKLSIEKISAKLGISRQAISKLFFDKTGMSPKYYSRLIRFNAMLYFLNKNPRASWLDITHRFDYYDQSHLIKDFYHFTGCSPKIYTRSPFQFLSGSVISL